MNYIVFDLEWNQCPYGKDFEEPGLPFEIIEIGAVKLNERKEVVDSFHALIRPRVYRRLHFQTSRVIGLTESDLKAGRDFKEAAADFLKWCGPEPKFCIWGTLDLTELQRNLSYYHMDDLLPGPILYEDVQKLFAIEYETRSLRRSLEYAVAFLKIPTEGTFHLAIDDASYTAKILQTISDETIRRNYSIDCFRNPKTREEEVYLRYDTYDKFISREFASREDVMADREATAVRCFLCHKNVRRMIRWFTDSSGRNHLAVGICPEHGYVKAKIRVREAASGRFYGIRTTKLIGDGELAEIRKKQLYLRIKRQNRKKKQ